MADEAAEDYRSSLADLTFNSKPQINMLTIVAEENKQYAAQIVEVIEDHVLKAPPHEKLPVMYLIDSIIKNHKDSKYRDLFAKNIVTTFTAVFEKVDEKIRLALYKLRETWHSHFPVQLLYTLDLAVREIDPAWPVLPGAQIHVNPKFLSKAQPQPQKHQVQETKKNEAKDAPVNRHPPVEEVAQKQQEEQRQKLLKENRENCLQLESDILIKQQLMAKQQEILRLHQQRLELELAKANAEIERQAKLLQKERDAAKQVQVKEAVSVSKTTTAATVTNAKATGPKTAAVRPSTRDPRIRSNAESRGNQNTTTSSQHTAIVHPTPSPKPTGDASAVGILDTLLPAKAPSNLAGNIFDNFQNIATKSEAPGPSQGAVASSGTTSSATVVSEGQKLNASGSSGNRKSNRSPKKDANKDSRAVSETSPQEKKADKDSRKKRERRNSSQKVSSPQRSKSPTERNAGKDSHVQRKRPSKHSRNRSPDSSANLPPSKFAKRGDHSPRASNLKAGAQTQSPRRNSVRERADSQRVQASESNRHETSRKRALEPDHSVTSPKASKKPKSLLEPDAGKCLPLSNDLMELFGKEDTDYRCISVSVAASSISHPAPLLMAPPRRRDSLLLSPSMSSSQSSGWAQFKASRPEDFPFQQSQVRPHRDSEGETSPALLPSPAVKLSAMRRAPLLPTPNLDEMKDISGQVTMDTLEKQRNELLRLQDMKRKLDEQQEHLLGISTTPQINSGIDQTNSQFGDLNHLQNLKKDLNEKQERLQAVIDNGMKLNDELNSAFTGFENNQPHPPVIRNKHLGILDESSRSPVYQENSRRKDLVCFPEERGGLLGDRPRPVDPRSIDSRPIDPRLERREETKALLPTPFIDRDGASNGSGATFSAPPPHRQLSEDMPPADDQFYYPEQDPRWSLRVQMQGTRPENLYSVFINGRCYDMFANRPHKIWVDRQEMMVRVDLSSRKLWCNDIAVYHLGEEERTSIIDGKQHMVVVRGPSKKLWIDSQLFDISLDSPPEQINIGGKEHRISIDSCRNCIIVDGFDICPFGTEEPQLVKLAFVKHTIQFQPPRKQILIDGNLCNLDLSGKFPVVIIDGKARGIRFDGPPQLVYIDDKPWTVHVDSSRKCHLDGPSSKPVFLSLGGPGHEIIVDDLWFELKFDGVEKYIKVGRKMRKFQLNGNTPEVKILGEVVFLKPHIGNAAGRQLMPGNVPVQPGRQNMMPGFGMQPLHRNSPNLLHRPESCDNIPSLLDMNVGRRMERNHSYGQFPGPWTQDGYPAGGNSDRHIQDGAPPVGPLGPRPVEGPFGSGPFESGRDGDGGMKGQHFADPRQRVPPHGEFGNAGAHDHSGRPQNVPFMDQKPQQMGMMQPLNQQAPPFGPGYQDAPQPGQLFGQFSFGGGQPPQAPWNSAESSSTNAEGEKVYVNTLFSKLLQMGLVQKTSENNSPVVDTAAANPAADDQGAVKVEAKEPEEEIKKEKEEELVEDVPDLTDFNLENLKKRYSGSIQPLHLGVQCPSCGIRFSSDTTEKYKEHLDWHFRKNRKEKEEMRVFKFRHWHYDILDWIKFEELSSAEDCALPTDTIDSSKPNKTSIVTELASNIISCPMASRDDKEDICDTCRESFEQFWDEEKEAWHLKDAIQVNGKTYHPICFEDVKEVSETDALVEEEEESNTVEMPSITQTLETQEEVVNQRVDDEASPEEAAATVKREVADTTPESAAVEDNSHQVKTESTINLEIPIKTEPVAETDAPLEPQNSVTIESTTTSSGSPLPAVSQSNELVLIKSEQTGIDSSSTPEKTVASNSENITELNE